MNKSDDRTNRAFVNSLAHCRALGIDVESVGDGAATMRMPWSPELVGDPRTSVIHGGAVSALLDTCGGAAVLSHPKNNAPTATIDLRIDYMRSASPGQSVRARAEVYHTTKSVAFVRAQAWDDDEQPVASATGTFTLTPTRANSRAWYESLVQPSGASGMATQAGATDTGSKRANAAHMPVERDPDALGTIPYVDFMGITFDRHGDELTAVMNFAKKLVGNPLIPALHGGAIAGFLEAVAAVELMSRSHSPANGGPGQGGMIGDADNGRTDHIKKLPKTIDFSIDFLRPGLAETSYARARINRFGSRFVSVRVEAWQGQRDRLFAEATGHFLNPVADG